MVNTERKSTTLIVRSTTLIVRKIPKLVFQPTRLQHSDDSILSLRSPKKLYIKFIFLFSQYYIHVMLLIKKLELRLMNVSVLLKIKFGHTQISVPKVNIPMSETACINPCFYKNASAEWVVFAQHSRLLCLQCCWVALPYRFFL